MRGALLAGGIALAVMAAPVAILGWASGKGVVDRGLMPAAWRGCDVSLFQAGTTPHLRQTACGGLKLAYPLLDVSCSQNGRPPGVDIDAGLISGGAGRGKFVALDGACELQVPTVEYVAAGKVVSGDVVVITDVSVADSTAEVGVGLQLFCDDGCVEVRAFAPAFYAIDIHKSRQGDWNEVEGGALNAPLLGVPFSSSDPNRFVAVLHGDHLTAYINGVQVYKGATGIQSPAGLSGVVGWNQDRSTPAEVLVSRLTIYRAG